MPKNKAPAIPAIQIDAVLVKFLHPGDPKAEGALSQQAYANLTTMTSKGGTLDLAGGLTLNIEFETDPSYQHGGKVIIDQSGLAVGFIPNPAPPKPVKTSKSTGSTMIRPDL